MRVAYEAVQEILFNKIKVHGFFMEYDTDARRRFRTACECCRRIASWCSAWLQRRAGGWSRRTRSARRIEEAARYVSLDQLCLSPQCGFASTEEGNVLGEEEQWAKLRMIVELADEVWG